MVISRDLHERIVRQFGLCIWRQMVVESNARTMHDFFHEQVASSICIGNLRIPCVGQIRVLSPSPYASHCSRPNPREFGARAIDVTGL